MSRFDLENYVQVKDRVRDFWDKHEVGQITTEMVHLDNADVKNRMVVIQATVRVDGVIVSTGIAKEREGLKGANMTAFIENCETSAVGRALANFGVSVDKSMASREEMEAVEAVEAGHTTTLAQIKSVGLACANEEIREEIREHWTECQSDPVLASEFLAQLEVAIQGLE
ncbi:MAG: hypothetical protein KOO63_02950 [Bacteroidales bacterium]|nr:hypothetical protein [Candidatus Latescibacterota bacterium]